MSHKPTIPENQLKAQNLDSLIEILKSRGHTLKQKKATAGFDGFVDTIVSVVKSKDGASRPVAFSHIAEFGNYILGKGTSLSLELEERSIKIGGNMPIMANALGHLGVYVNCVGAFGLSQIHPVFKQLSSNCTLHSFADPGTSTALEFTDGKIMLGNMGLLNSIGWDRIKDAIGIEKLISIYKESEVVAVLNWSEIDASTGIWKGFLNDVLPFTGIAGKKPFLFVDLSDCSKRPDESIHEALNLLKEFKRYASVALSLNKNEAQWIYQVLFAGEQIDFNNAGRKILEKLGLETLVIHSRTESMAFHQNDTKVSPSFFSDSPKISTGAGDHFNAGFCVAQLLELDLQLCLVLANAVSGYYVRTGVSPSLPTILNFLEEHRRDMNLSDAS